MEEGLSSGILILLLESLKSKMILLLHHSLSSRPFGVETQIEVVAVEEAGLLSP